MIRVLFVCLGNICRSPMAEAVFRHQVRDAGLQGQIEADSAGTGDWHLGEQPHPGTRRILADNGIASDHCARQVTAADLQRFDYVLTMDEANRRAVDRLGRGRARVTGLLEHAPETGMSDVPDPYYTGDFGQVYHLVSAATQGLLQTICREHGL